jgi:outer membrane lipopolysaccharide assembly protein LptE/RlpB
LQHSLPPAKNLGSLHLLAENPHNTSIEELSQVLSLSGVNVVSSRAEANYSIVIVDSRQSRRVSMTNGYMQAIEYQFNKRVDFLITDSEGNQLVPLTTISVEKVYAFDAQDMLASANEERAAKEWMQRKIIGQILNHLRVTASHKAES